MFTGIVEEMGRIAHIDAIGDSARIVINAESVLGDLSHGDSVNVNGVCLTAVDITTVSFSADVMGQTLKMSALGMLNTGDCVNLERAMLPTSRMGGHIVQGHVDAVGSIVSRDKHENWEVVRISLPVSIAHYVVERGSIAVNGVSLTVSAVDTNNQWFEVSLIPTTLNETTLGAAEVGSSVNLESDVIARHVEKMMQR